MANEPLQDLADALKKAAQPVIINSELIKQASQASLIPPMGFEEMLKAAFRLDKGETGLQISFKPEDVGKVEDNHLKVTGAKLPKGFLGADADHTSVIVTFLPQPDKLDVQIEVRLSKWRFTDFFPYMTGWTFENLDLVADSATFIFSTFSTPEADYSWQGNALCLQAGQNFAANLTIPEAFGPIFELLKIGHVPSTLGIWGPITLDRADNEAVLYPDMDLKARISDISVEVFHIKAKNPYIGLRIQTVEFGEDDDDGRLVVFPIDPVKNYYQTPSLYLGLDVELVVEEGVELGDHQSTIILDLESRLIRGGLDYSFDLMADEKSEVKLSPATVVSLMAGNSYIQLVPAKLQQFLVFVQLNCLSIESSLDPPTIDSLGISLGNAKGQRLVLFKDPTSDQEFAIESLELSWIILDPLDSNTREHLIDFSSTFTLWPEVFRKANGKPGGLFIISIDQDLTIDGKFEGSVSLDSLLKAITNGLIGLPNGVEISFSNVYLSLNPIAKSYAFAFTFNGEVNFIKWDDKPLIKFQDVLFQLSAKTPSSTGDGSAKTVYQGSISGIVSIGPISINASVDYDGTSTPKVWRLKTGLAQPLPISDLIKELFRSVQKPDQPYQLPDFISESLTVDKFEIDATIPIKEADAAGLALPAEILPVEGGKTKSSYSISGAIAWNFDIAGFQINTVAEIGLQYDGNRAQGKEFSGSIIGKANLGEPINAEIMVGYRFGPASEEPAALAHSDQDKESDSKTLWVQWEGIRASYDITGQSLTFTLNGWTVGRLIQSLANTIGDPYFTLESPWDFLNQISLNGLELKIDLRKDAKYRLSAEYKLPSPIKLGFLTINGIVFKRVEGKITLAVVGSFSSGIPDPDGKWKNLFDPKGKGQDVKDMPDVPGQGNKYFDLRLLALGQHIGIRGHDSFGSTSEAIKALEGIPSTKGKSNPINPTDQTVGQPYYNPANNWLVAADFGIMKVGTVYTFDCMFVFNDPDLYGLRIAFSGEKAKVLAGLYIDVLYRKITDDVGVYQIEFCFPKSLRQLDFGSFNIILPIVGIQIYTNGDFLFDFGFPRNLDFSRSFTVQAIVLGVPVMGSAGFYFGKLSSSTATFLPASEKGTFDPVIVFGLGIQLGLGYTFEKGPLKAGFSITVFGIVEGIIAPWHPYSTENPSLPSPSQIQDSGTLQSDYYFKLQGTFGIIGKLYGSIDFAIVKASVYVEIYLSAQITYESYREIPLSATASIKVAVSLTIDLFFFKIKISFSFSATITQSLKIGYNHPAPWDSDASYALLMRHARKIAPLDMRGICAEAKEPIPKLCLKPVAGCFDDGKPMLTLHPVTQFTVLCREGGGLADQEGAFVLLFAMDAPTGNRDGSSFESLCEAILPWIVDAELNATGSETVIETVQGQTVSRDVLQTIMEKLSKADHPPIEAKKILEFLQSAFTINFQAVTESTHANVRERLEDGATIFPAFTDFAITIPYPKGDETRTIPFENYVKITDAYRETIAGMFKELAAKVEEEMERSHNMLSSESDEGIPLGQFLFEDYFLLLARQLVQAGLDAMDDYAYQLLPNDSLRSIIDWANDLGNSLDVMHIVQPNLDFPLSGGKVLRLSGITYTVQIAESINGIVGHYSDSPNPPRWTVTQESLILANAGLSNLINPDVTIVYRNISYTTKPGDSFEKIASGLNIELKELAKQDLLYDRKDLLAASTVLSIPEIAYTTAAGNTDTIHLIIRKFGIELASLVSVDSNLLVEGIFYASEESNPIHIANLQQIKVSDLWGTIKKTGQISQIAGMAARYQLHGMRLPKKEGLDMSGNFLYPKDQSGYGLYQLTGQQFPTTPNAGSGNYSIKLSKKDLTWVQFNGSGDIREIELDLTKQASRLSIVLAYARSTVYNPPNLALSQLDEVAIAPKRYSMKSATLWSTSDIESLADVTRPPSETMSSSDDSAAKPQVRPILWEIPDSLQGFAAERQKRLESQFPAAEHISYMPVLRPQVGTTDPSTSITTFSDIENFTMASRIEFQIKKLAQTDDIAPQTPDANDVVPEGPGNAGSPARELAPFNYELIGPSPEDAILLQRLLTSMDSLGDGIISGLFLLYPQGNSETKGLTSRGQLEFLSFITQTNLSTETNPPQILKALKAEGEQIRGIANKYHEFIKLLWELSTVRSGGYYLFYQLLDEGFGLPDSIFDGNDIATLTLVITYHRSDNLANAERMTNFVNAMATMEPIDLDRSVMTLKSKRVSVDSLPIEKDETLDEVSALYGIGVGELVRLNSDIALTAGKEIPISGAFHQIRPADLDSDKPLDAIACYYSKGAKTPITAEDISGFNPGVPVSIFSVFRIPEITYVVNADASGPSNTFSKIQKYYNLPIDALAYDARLAGGLIPAETKLKLDLQNFDVQPALGIGNLGVMLTRDNLGDPDLPDNPTEEDVKRYAKTYLSSLYTLLANRIYGNSFFENSPLGLSFGPQISLSQEEIAAYRHPNTRLAAMAEGESERMQYNQAIGFGNYSKINPAPEADQADSNMPPKNANPYIGIGTFAQLDMTWLDVFGNRCVTYFDTPPKEYSGPMNCLPIPIYYTDRLIGLAQWPNVSAFYTYGGSSGKPELEITLKLNTDAYAYASPSNESDLLSSSAVTEIPQGQQNAVNDLKTYTKIYFQQNQDYDSLNIPGLSGKAVSIDLTNTILEKPKFPLSEDRAQQIRSFLSKCLGYVARRATDQPGGDIPEEIIKVPISLDAVSSNDIIKLSLSLTFTRKAALSHPALRAIQDGLSTASTIMPVSNDQMGKDRGSEGENKSVSLKAFADDLEGVFQTDDWQLKVGVGAALLDEQGTSGAHSVWAVRLANKSGAPGLRYLIDPKPSFYSPRPLATCLQTFDAEISKYKTGKPFPDGSPENMTFTGVDMNAWLSVALKAIDSFLSAAYAAPAFIIDQNKFPDDPGKNGYLAKILDHKKTLADAISRTVEPILVDNAMDDKTRKAAQDKMRQKLLNEIGSALTATSVAVFSVSEARFKKPLSTSVSSPPRFYGLPRGNPPTGESAKDQQFSLSTAKIPLTDCTEDGDSRLSFLFTSKDVADHPYVQLDLSYDLSHLEHDIKNLRGIDGYQQSSWISFINGPFKTPIGSGTIDLPVVLRSLPMPPTVESQAADGIADDGDMDCYADLAPIDLAKWNYSFSYLYRSCAQDSFRAISEFNLPNELLLKGDDEDEKLFQALAQLISVYPEIAKDFESFVRKIDGRESSPSNMTNASLAISAFEKLVSDLADGYDRWSKKGSSDRLSSEPTHIIYTYDIRLREEKGDGSTETGNALIDVFKVSIVPKDAMLPVPVIQIDPERYEPERVLPSIKDAQATYRYKLKQTSALGDSPKEDRYLSYEDALDIPRRAVAFQRLDVFAYQSAQSSLQVLRNQFLVPGVETTQHFKFQTPVVKLADPTRPLLAYRCFDLGSLADHGLVPISAKIQDYLQEFFESLLGDAQGQEVLVRIRSAYSYNLLPNTLDENGSEVVPRTLLPINLLPPEPITFRPGELLAFIAPVSDGLLTWMERHSPSIDKSSQFNFDLSIFAGKSSAQQVELLKIRNLFIDSSEVEEVTR